MPTFCLFACACTSQQTEDVGVTRGGWATLVLGILADRMMASQSLLFHAGRRRAAVAAMGFVLLSMILPSSGTQLPGDVDAMYDGWSGHTLPKPSAGFGLEGNGTGITVHIVPHSHEDLGWLKTVDECFYGSNNSIQHAAVQYILDTVVAGLRDHPDRRFTQAEQGFFQRWWHMQDNATQAMVRQLIDNGQLSFVGGGWSQHDEACPHYVTMIDQVWMSALHPSRCFLRAAPEIALLAVSRASLILTRVPFAWRR